MATAIIVNNTIITEIIVVIMPLTALTLSMDVSIIVKAFLVILSGITLLLGDKAAIYPICSNPVYNI